MQTLPLSLSLLFGLTVIVAVWLLYKASRYSTPFLLIVVLWIAAQSMLGINGFYKINTTPPRFMLLTMPPVLFLLIALLLPKGRRFMDGLNLKVITIFHTIRIPVEIVLYWLLLYKAVPQVMTFEGRNFDVLSGLSAPFVWYFGLVKGRLSKTFLLIWNLVAMCLLLNVVTIAVLSVVGKQQIGLIYFPFLLLPSCLVPLVLLSHVSAIRQLLKKQP
jgi:hypothetical protein